VPTRDRLRWASTRGRRIARRATQELRYQPSFLVIGATRGGTSSLSFQLRRHPAILGAAVKEVHYFDRNYDKGPGWYRSMFPLRVPGAFTGRREPRVFEASPDYLVDPRAPARVGAFDPSMRLIALLRDPVERALSHYRFGAHLEPLTLREALEAESGQSLAELHRMLEDPGYRSGERRGVYLARGDYLEQLEAWLRFFPREQLLVVRSEDLFERPEPVLEEIFDFIEVPRVSLAPYPVRNRTDPQEVDPAIRQWLVERFDEPNRRLYRFLGRDLGWSRPGRSG
jgi:Sulfotransferase domain